MAQPQVPHHIRHLLPQLDPNATDAENQAFLLEQLELIQARLRAEEAQRAVESYLDAKRWFAIMDEYEVLFKAGGDRDPWRTPDLESRLCHFFEHVSRVNRGFYSNRARLEKLEDDLLDAAFFNIEKSRRNAELVLDDNVRAVLRDHVEKVIDALEDEDEDAMEI